MTRSTGNSGDPRGGTQRTVLVVEDDQDVRDTVCETLVDAGYAVSSATNGLLALSALEGPSALPDLILLDLMMPVMNGAEFLQAMRKDPRLCMLPVVLLTADGHAMAEAVKLGATHGLRKPVQLRDLIATVSKYCEER